MGNKTSFKPREEHPNWKGGIRYRCNYRYILIPDYFGASKKGYIEEHIYVFQEFNKCCMLPWGVVHHIDLVRKDYCNNMSWNLMGMMRSNHTKLHSIGNKYSKKDTSNRLCILCKNKTSISKKGNEKWYEYLNGHICHKCYKKLNRKKETENQRKRRALQRLRNLSH